MPELSVLTVLASQTAPTRDRPDLPGQTMTTTDHERFPSEERSRKA